jgi:predicted neuraminidase
LEITVDLGMTWQRVGPINDGQDFAAIQPTLLIHPDGRVQALCRSRQGVITESRSQDGGKTWSKMAATTLPNPNSGIDAVTLRDGRQLLVYNHTPQDRTPLNLALSEDGVRWEMVSTLENGAGEFSYPAVIQTSDGLVHVTYTHRRDAIKHIVITLRN